MEGSVVRCTFCQNSVNYNVGDLKTHLTEEHRLGGKQTLFMAFIILDNEPDDLLSQLLSKVDQRVQDLLEKHGELDEANSEKDLGDIQKRIVDELGSEDSDSENELTENREEPEKPLPNVVIKEEVVQNEALDDEDSVDIMEKFTRKNICKLCYEAFENKESLKEHEEAEHLDDAEALKLTKFTLRDLKFSCSKCPMKFLTENLLNKHMEKQHKVKRMVKCRICQVSIPTNTVNLHMMKHKSDTQYQCQLCYKTFKKKESKQAHCERVHQDEAEFLTREITESDLRFSCGKCQLRFVSKSLLTSHTDMSHTEEQNYFDTNTNTFSCPFCHSQSETGQKLRNHLKKCHSSDLHLLGTIQDEDYTFPCNLCDLKFVKETHVDFHRIRVHFPNDKKVPCDVCEKVIMKYNYSVHKATHSNEKNFQCLLCNLKLKTKGTLKHHKSKHVTAEEKEFFAKGQDLSMLKFHCSKCDKKFLSERLLLQHSKVHSKNRKECNICYKTLSDRYRLLSHLRIFHKEEEEFWDKKIPAEKLKYSCQICSQKFLSEQLLRSHSSSHKVKACHICYKRIKSSNMRQHLEKVHKAEQEYWSKDIPEEKLVYPCDNCEKKCVSASALKLHSRLHVSEGFDQLKAECYDQETKTYNCKLCYKPFKDFYNVMNHMCRYHKTMKETWSRKIESHELNVSCSKCDKKFLNQQLQKMHYIVHSQNEFGDLKRASFDNNTKRFRCKLCSVSYKQVYNLGSHIATVHETDADLFKREITEKDFVYHCDEPNCNMKFPSEPSLQYHKKLHEVKRARTTSKRMKAKVKLESLERYCRLCYIKYKKPHFLKAHKMRVHSMELEAFERDISEEDLKYPCSKCSRSYLTANTLQHHMNVRHYRGTVSVCKLCRIDFKDPSKFHGHKYRVHKEDTWAFKTDISQEALIHQCHCGERFLTKSSLAFHKVNIHKEARKKFVSSKVGSVKCQLCYESFKKTFYLSAHLKKQHQEDKHFLSGGDISDAMRKYFCRFCDLKFVSLNTMRFHTRKRHIQTVTYCGLCYVKFRDSAKFQAHKKNVHKSPAEIEALKTKIDSQSFEFSCNFCDLKFMTSNILKYHKTYSHREERRKDITCEYCDKVFKYSPNRKANFENHLRRVHNLENSGIDDVSQETQEPSESGTVQNFLSFFNSLQS